MVELGEIVMRPVYYGQGFAPTAPEPGKVVYIHPEGRWYTVEFTYWRNGRRETFRESYHLKYKPTCPAF